MAVQFNPVSPFALFQANGPLGFFPNNFAANAGDVPNLLWVSSLQTPILNSFSPVFPPLVTDIFGGGPAPLGSAFRPAPLGANAGTNGTNGTTVNTPATSVQGGTAGLTSSLGNSNLLAALLSGQAQASLGGLNGNSLAGLGGNSFAGLNNSIGQSNNLSQSNLLSGLLGSVNNLAGFGSNPLLGSVGQNQLSGFGTNPLQGSLGQSQFSGLGGFSGLGSTAGLGSSLGGFSGLGSFGVPSSNIAGLGFPVSSFGTGAVTNPMAGNIGIPGMMSVGGQAFNGNSAFTSQMFGNPLGLGFNVRV